MAVRDPGLIALPLTSGLSRHPRPLTAQGATPVMHLASGGEDGSVRVWDVSAFVSPPKLRAPGMVASRTMMRWPAVAAAMCVSRTSPHVACVMSDFTLQVGAAPGVCGAGGGGRVQLTQRWGLPG